jgi:predicted GNAT family N-acyltransferase
VPEKQRGKGAGTEILKQVTDDADKYGSTLKLHAFGEGLHNWYTQRGFQMTGHDYMNGIPHPRFERKPQDVKGI